MGNQWHLQTVSVKKPPEICAKKSAPQKPAKLTGFFLIKTRISANNPIIAIYSTGVDALPLEPENPIGKQAIGARIGLKIMHLMELCFRQLKNDPERQSEIDPPYITQKAVEQGKYPVPGFVRHATDPLFMQILQEFSIEQGLADT